MKIISHPATRPRLLGGLAVLLGLTFSTAALAQLEPAPRYPQLAPFCPGGAPQPNPLSQQLFVMENSDPQRLFFMPRDGCAGQAPRFILIGDGPMRDIHLRIYRECNANGIPAAMYCGPGGAAYNQDCAALGQGCANRQSLIVNHEAVRWFGRRYPGCELLELGNRGPGETVPATSGGVNWTGMERFTLGQCGTRTTNPTWPGMEWGARPPITYVPIGPRPPVGPPAETWPGMEWGAPRPSTYMPGGGGPAACPTPPTGGGGGTTTLYCGLPPPRIPNWMRPSGPMQGDMMFNGAMGMGTFGPIAYAGGGMTMNGLARCANDDPSGIPEATAGTFLLTTGGSVTLYSGGTFLTGAGYVGAGGYLTAGGTALGTVAVPATLCVATATAGYCTGRAIDNASGGRISDGAATAACAVGDTFANVCWRWWAPGCHWNYDLTSTSADMFGESARCNMRGPAPVCGGGRVQAGGVDPPYEEEEADSGAEIVAAAACSTGHQGTGTTWPVWMGALVGLGVFARRRRRMAT